MCRCCWNGSLTAAFVAAGSSLCTELTDLGFLCTIILCHNKGQDTRLQYAPTDAAQRAKASGYCLASVVVTIKVQSMGL